MTTITMIIAGKSYTFDAEVEDELINDIAMFGNIPTIEEAIAMFGDQIPDLVTKLSLKTKATKPKITQTKGEDKKVETKAIPATDNNTTEKKMEKTKAVRVIMPGDLGAFWLSKEFLQATGMVIDAKLVRTDKEGNVIGYDMSMMELASKCSQNVRLQVEALVASRIKDIVSGPKVAPIKEKEITKEDQGEIFRPVGNGGKKAAEEFMIGLLRQQITGNWGNGVPLTDKAQWIADFTGAPFSTPTAEAIQLTTDKGMLFISIPSNLYKQNRERWNVVLDKFRDACRGSRMEYQRTRSGKLPLQPRAMRKNETF